jgi:hypothetical protein
MITGLAVAPSRTGQAKPKNTARPIAPHATLGS